MSEEPKRQRYYADFNIQITVYFEDDGENDVTDQAYEAAQAFTPNSCDDMKCIGLEMVGKPLPEGPTP